MLDLIVLRFICVQITHHFEVESQSKFIVELRDYNFAAFGAS